MTHKVSGQCRDCGFKDENTVSFTSGQIKDFKTNCPNCNKTTIYDVLELIIYEESEEEK